MSKFLATFLLVSIFFLMVSCSNKIAKKVMVAKAFGLYRGAITFAQGRQSIFLELLETGHYALRYNSIIDSLKITKENGVYVLGADSSLQLARRSLYLRNFRVSNYKKLLVLSAEGLPYTAYFDSSFYLEKISNISD
jgi:hypothetical protein